MRRFSSGTSSSSAVAETPPRASSRRRAATGSLSAQARGAGGPSPCETRVGRSSSDISAASRMAVSQSAEWREAPRPWKPGVDIRAPREVGIAVAAATSAESGISRPGVTSRSCAIRSRVSHRDRTAPRVRRPRTLCSPEVRRHASTRTVGVKPRRWSNSWRAQSALPVSSSWAARMLRSSTSTSTSRAAYSSHGSGSGRVDQSTAECSFRSWRSSRTSTSVARPTRG
ncbi:hypothetical protein ASE01_07550 [Nocardioides sp. Root190]|nr:hypothetical protein ASE01_07550 [Nocardioides sp. Root190]